jgi:hypothetical protein
VATQVPVAEWHVRFPDPTIGDAILDRLVHNAYRLALKGESRRKIDSVSVTCWGHEIGQKTPERHLGLCKRPKNRAGPCP